MNYTATLNYLRIAPRKVRIMADAIRSANAAVARRTLLFAEKGSARPLLKLLDSAIANAKDRSDAKPEDLKIAKILVDDGPMLKRYMPRAFGRASMIRKRMSTVTLTLSDGKPEKAVSAPAKSKAEKPAAAPKKKPASSDSTKKSSNSHGA